MDIDIDTPTPSLKTEFGMVYSPVERKVYARMLDELVLLRDRFWPAPERLQRSVEDRKNYGGEAGGAWVVVFANLDEAQEQRRRCREADWAKDAKIKKAVWVDQTPTDTSRPSLGRLGAFPSHFAHLQETVQDKKSTFALVLALYEYDRSTCHSCMVLQTPSATSIPRIYYCGCPVCGDDKGALHRCTGCRHVAYCSRDHQQQHLPYHRLVCDWHLARSKFVGDAMLKKSESQ